MSNDNRIEVVSYMKYLIIILSIFVLNSEAFAAKKVKCPAYIVDNSTGIGIRGASQYRCFVKKKDVISAGFAVGQPTAPVSERNFSNTTGQNTTSFTISKTPATITYTNGSCENFFDIDLRYVSDGSLVQGLVSEIGPISSSTQIYKKGTFYLEVNTSCSWQVTVSQ